MQGALTTRTHPAVKFIVRAVYMVICRTSQVCLGSVPLYSLVTTATPGQTKLILEIEIF